MITVMPPEVQACVDGIPPGHRPLFERLHRLILTAQRGAQVTLSYKMPAYKAGNRRLYAGAWNRGILVCGWQKDRDGGFASRHPSWSPAREPSIRRTATRPASATRTSSAWRAATGPLTRTRQASLRRHACRVTSGKPGH